MVIIGDLEFGSRQCHAVLQECYWGCHQHQQREAIQQTAEAQFFQQAKAMNSEVTCFLLTEGQSRTAINRSE
jgi:hypothetical protein